MSDQINQSEKRSIGRLRRDSGISWQLNVENDHLITKNISNISPMGMAFKAPSSTEIVVGQNIRFTLSLNQGESFECEGRVIWTKKAIERQGAMKQFGVAFMKLPQRLNAAITCAMNESALRIPTRESSANQDLNLRTRALLQTSLGILLVLALAAAFFAVVWLHEQSRSNSLAQKFHRDAVRKVSGTADGR